MACQSVVMVKVRACDQVASTPGSLSKVSKRECVVEASDQITLGHKINILCVATALKVYQSLEKQHAKFWKGS